MNNEISSLPAVLDALTAIAEARSLDEHRRLVVEQLRILVPCEMAAYNEVAVADGAVAVTTDPPGEAWSGGPEAFARHMHEHPVLAAHRQGDLRAAAISDFLSEPQFRRLALYREVYKPLGIADQMAMTLEVTAERVSAVALNRPTWGFSESEREVLDLITPNLAQARRNVIARDDLAAVVGGVDALGIGLITLDAELRPQSWSARALELMYDAFDHTRDDPPTLPTRVREWLDSGAHEPLIAVSEGRSIEVGVIDPTPTSRALIVRERVAVTAEQATRIGLTARQADVLPALMEGATNEEIAAQLELSPRTVQKHVEGILRALGVHTRTAAAARARDALAGGALDPPAA
jgi:DNA-binding CsgD family transcriptional regulator